MTNTAQVGYGVAAACFAVVLAKTSEPDWWRKHRAVGFLIGFSIPLCILGAWLSETRLYSHSFFGITFIPHSPEVMAVGAWFGILVGLVALVAYLFTVCDSLAIGFLFGALILGFFAEVTDQSRRTQGQPTIRRLVPNNDNKSSNLTMLLTATVPSFENTFDD